MSVIDLIEILDNNHSLAQVQLDLSEHPNGVDMAKAKDEESNNIFVHPPDDSVNQSPQCTSLLPEYTLSTP